MDDVWWEVAGRAHPVVLHMPFGLLVALALLELVAWLRKRPLEGGVRGILVALVALSAAAAAGSGWLLGNDGSYVEDDIALHRNLGLATAGCAVLAAIAAWRRMGQLYGAALAVSLLLVLSAGHFGGALTHGEGFLLAPLNRDRDATAEPAEPAVIASATSTPVEAAVDAPAGGDGDEAVPGDEATGAPDDTAPTDVGVSASLLTDAPSWYASRIRPLLVERCGKCHGAERQKGRLALHEFEPLMAGGRGGAVVVPGDAAASELVRRMHLPLVDDDHMPPEGKPQPAAAEVAELVAWIDAGASLELPWDDARLASFAVAEPSEEDDAQEAIRALDFAESAAAAEAVALFLEPEAPEAAPTAAVTAAPAGPPPAEALDALAAALVHVEVIDPARHGLWVDYAARPDLDAATLADELAPVQEHVVDLTLSGTAVGDDVFAVVAALPRLEQLDLSRTEVTSAGVADLADAPALARLNLTATAVDDGAVDALRALPRLTHLALWGTDVTEAGVARLVEGRSALDVQTGEGVLVDALELEPELVLGVPSIYEPVNERCPVSGGPVNPKRLVVFGEQVIGFCCENCPGEFWDDPEAFPLPGQGPKPGPRLGKGEHTYEWVAGWLQLPEGREELGNTHGEVVFDKAGNLYLNTDTEQAVMSFAPDGSYRFGWGAEFASGLHGMQLVQEDDGEFLYFVHFGRHEFGKATLEGDVVWRQGYPEASGKYEGAGQFNPTSITVAPDGRFFVADGYGQQWVHLYDADANYLRSIGGRGSEPGQFQTCHGVWGDTRREGEEPELLVADRENHRLQRFTLDGEWLGIIGGDDPEHPGGGTDDPLFRRPCKIQQQGEYLVVPDLAGRVTVLDGDNALVTQLGDNPDPSLRAVNGVPRDRWVDGEFLAPHSAAWDADGNLYVMDWNAHGRVNKLARVR